MYIQSNNNVLALKGSGFRRPSSSPLKFAPHKRPSRRTLNNYACFYSETLTKAPQQVWKTLKHFDYPPK